MTAPDLDLVARLRAAGCVFAEDEAALLSTAAADAVELERLVALRVAGLPLEHVVGWARFAGLRVVVDPGVFVPRPRTERLVALAARLLAGRPGPGARRQVVVDVCCGSGALGVAVTARVGGAELHAVDLDPAAVACARRNVEPVGGTVHEGDLFAPLPGALRGAVDVVVACPPYVPTDEIRLLPPEAREHEARVALDGGGDGLDVTRRVVGEAPTWLRPGGSVLVETSERQLPDVVAAAQAAGLLARADTDPELDVHVVVATRPGPFDRAAPEI